MAAVGALLISSGIALMAAPTTASAAQFKHEGPHKVVVCKYVGTPPGVLDHVIIVSVNSMPTGFSGTFPYAWTDAHGTAGGSKAIRWAAAGEQAKDVALSECGSQPEAIIPTAPTFVEPTCTTAPVVNLPTMDHVTYQVTGNKVAGGTVTVKASVVAPAQLKSGAVAEWPHTFITPTGCTNVSPPSSTTQVSPPKTKAQTTTEAPTVVEAGLPGTTDGNGADAGLALILAGLALLAGAGGLVLVEEGERK